MAVRYITHIPELGKFYGAYSPASKSESAQLFSIAGQLGGLPDGSLPGDGSVYAQTKQSFANLRTVLTGLGLAFTDVLRFNTFLVGRSSIEQFMTRYRMDNPAALHRIRVGVPATVEHSSEAGPETGKLIAETTQVGISSETFTF